MKYGKNTFLAITVDGYATLKTRFICQLENVQQNVSDFCKIE